MAQVAGTGGPHFKITFNPRAKLDLSQVVDRRAEPQKRGTIMSYIRSQQKLIRRSTQPIHGLGCRRCPSTGKSWGAGA
jgi:hypothetical protein